MIPKISEFVAATRTLIRLMNLNPEKIYFDFGVIYHEEDDTYGYLDVVVLADDIELPVDFLPRPENPIPTENRIRFTVNLYVSEKFNDWS